MKCQHCGNELGQDEVFCGQCGNPNATPVQATEMMQTPSTRSGLLGSGNRAGAFPSSQPGPLFTPENMSSPSQSAIRQGPQQQGGFYHDATEAMSMVPGSPAQYPPASYPQQGFQNGSSLQNGYNSPGQFGTQAQQQPFLTGNYPQQTTYPPVQANFSNGQFGQGYGSRPGTMTPPPQKRNNTVMVVGIVCLVFAIITVGVVGTLFALKGGSNQPTSTPTTVAQATATATPSPTPSPSPTAIPSPTAAPTAAPDANFGWCNTQCTQSGYQIEFPNGWALGATQNGPGTQFTSTGGGDTIYAAVKTPSSSATSAGDLLTADIANFSSLPGFVGPQAVLSTTIGGENWSYSTLTYQLNGQVEQVNIYATVHQGKGYVIELQAAQAQFPTISTQYFDLMLKSFQFIAPGQ